MRPSDKLSGMKGLLFLCVANSARSQMAEGLARRRFGDEVLVQSAGSRASTVNPLAVRVMQEIGIDIRGHTSKNVDAIDPQAVDTVVTLCAEEVCPMFLASARHVHWPLLDPAGGTASEHEGLQKFRQARDEIEKRLPELTTLGRECL